MSAQTNFKYLMLLLFFILFFLFLFNKSNNKHIIGLACYTISYAQLIWASLWNATFINYQFTPLIKIIKSIIIVYLLWQLKNKD